MIKIRIVPALVLALGLMALNVGVAREEKKADSAKEKLVGVWRVVKSELPSGASVEFTRESKVKLVVPNPNKDEKPLTILGTWSVEGSDLKVSMTGLDGRDQKQTLKIVELTDVKLLTKDEKGMLDEFKKDLVKMPK